MSNTSLEQRRQVLAAQTNAWIFVARLNNDWLFCEFKEERQGWWKTKLAYLKQKEQDD